MTSIITRTNNEILFSKHKEIILVYTGEVIDDCQFMGNPKIYEVVLPPILKTIKREGFRNCKNLQNIKIPENVNSLGYSCFSDCENLKFVEFSPKSNIIFLSIFLFQNCKKLENINLPSTISMLGNNCFENCINLKQLVLPDNLAIIGSSCFENCKSLTEIKLTPNITTIKQNTFYKCSSLKEIFIPSNLNSLGSYAFSSCHNLEKVIFQSTHLYFLYTTFTNCKKMKLEISLKTQGNQLNENIYSFPCDTINIIPSFLPISKKTLEIIEDLSTKDTKVTWSGEEFSFRTLGGDIIDINLDHEIDNILDTPININKELVVECAKSLNVRPEEIFIVDQDIILYHYCIDIVVNTKFSENITSDNITLVAEAGFSSEEKEEITVFDALLQISKLLNIEFDPFSTVVLVDNQPVEGNDLKLSEANIADNSVITLL